MLIEPLFWHTHIKTTFLLLSANVMPNRLWLAPKICKCSRIQGVCVDTHVAEGIATVAKSSGRAGAGSLRVVTTTELVRVA